jgi:hypothetical protein
LTSKTLKGINAVITQFFPPSKTEIHIKIFYMQILIEFLHKRLVTENNQNKKRNKNTIRDKIRQTI